MECYTTGFMLTAQPLGATTACKDTAVLAAMIALKHFLDLPAFLFLFFYLLQKRMSSILFFFFQICIQLCSMCKSSCGESKFLGSHCCNCQHSYIIMSLKCLIPADGQEFCVVLFFINEPCCSFYPFIVPSIVVEHLQASRTSHFLSNPCEAVLPVAPDSFSWPAGVQHDLVCFCSLSTSRFVHSRFMLVCTARV